MKQRSHNSVAALWEFFAGVSSGGGHDLTFPAIPQLMEGPGSLKLIYIVRADNDL